VQQWCKAGRKNTKPARKTTTLSSITMPLTRKRHTLTGIAQICQVFRFRSQDRDGNAQLRLKDTQVIDVSVDV